MNIEIDYIIKLLDCRRTLRGSIIFSPSHTACQIATGSILTALEIATVEHGLNYDHTLQNSVIKVWNSRGCTSCKSLAIYTPMSSFTANLLKKILTSCYCIGHDIMDILRHTDIDPISVEWMGKLTQLKNNRGFEESN